MTAYYNEIDPYAASWLRNLIAAGHIAPGEVDERDIRDVHPSDIREFTQCHFFAGIGVWSYALRRAGWSDDRSVWTGSCPCQPFSSAGAGLGFADERHLWPHWHHLISECRPAIVLGEQVASKDASSWVDLVQDDLEALDFAFGAVPFPSASVGAPHIRDRLYWVAHANHARLEVRGGRSKQKHQPKRREIKGRPAGLRSMAGWMADSNINGFGSPPSTGLSDAERNAEPCGRTVGMADAGRDHDTGEVSATSAGQPQAIGPADKPCRRCAPHGAGAGPVNGFWRDADWLLCRDGKWRPVEPGTSPLAHGAPARVGRLRAYGNSINAEAARLWIETVMEHMP